MRSWNVRNVLSETERDGLLDLDLEGIDRRLEMVRREREEAAQARNAGKKNT